MRSGLGGALMRRGAAGVGLVAMAAGLAAGAQMLPRTEFETLAGGKLTLPEAARGKVELLVVGFSHASSKPTGDWGKAMEKDCAETAGLECYQVAVLEAVPRLFRGMVTGGMKKGIAENKRGRFLLLYHDEDEWKKLTGFGDGDTAYVMVVNGAGEVVWKTSGAAEGARVAEAREQARRAMGGAGGAGK